MDLAVLLTPGDYLAKRYDSNFSRFAQKAKDQGGWARIGVLLEYVFAPYVGFLSGLFSLLWPILILFALYPLVVMAEPWIWRKYYGKIANGVGAKGAFLANLDMIYLFTIGYGISLIY